MRKSGQIQEKADFLQVGGEFELTEFEFAEFYFIPKDPK